MSNHGRPEHLDRIAARLRSTYDRAPGINDSTAVALPDRESVGLLCRQLLSLLFPGFFSSEPVTGGQLDTYLRSHLSALESTLLEQVARALRFRARQQGVEVAPAAVRDLVAELLLDLVEVRELVVTDVDWAFNNDPAAAERETVVLSYPSVEAVSVQRFAHRMYRRGVPVLPRMMTEYAHGRTGVDIHPGAAIDESFFIDHCTGVVIGETSRIGKKCVLYQGVGLVAWNPLARDDKGELTRGQANKRHPDLQDHVTIYAGATILGGDTVIGHHSVVGGNVWLTHSVEPYSAVRAQDPGLVIKQRGPKKPA
ncbi:MAG: serine acetyltransferase [Planctomycetes bacterium]|nr:serine acetyltransferase [Planctomycetota bacterium]MBN8558331.1 serine acetyltransferase [Burkholderiales bacterium]